jgi:hypothetical protein
MAIEKETLSFSLLFCFNFFLDRAAASRDNEDGKNLLPLSPDAIYCLFFLGDRMDEHSKQG